MSLNHSVIVRPQPGCAGTVRVYLGGIFIGRIITTGGVPAVYDCTGRLRRGDDFSRLALGLPPAITDGGRP